MEEIGLLGRGKRGSLPGLPLVSSCLCTWARSAKESLFQVWVIANKVQGSHGLSRGTVCRRMGVQPREPKGQGWDYGIGVSSRALWDGSISLSMHGGLWGSLW